MFKSDEGFFVFDLFGVFKINICFYFSVLQRSGGKKRRAWNFFHWTKGLLFFSVSDTDIKELEDVFGLNGQVEHKLNFLKKNVSKDIKLVLIAHSIGCYITLEMMKRASELQVHEPSWMEVALLAKQCTCSAYG